MNRALALFLIFLAGFYALGLNAWFIPESTDDIMYFELAKSHATGKGHTFQGETIGDWPPVWPLILSIPMRLGIDQLWAGKLLSLFFAVGAVGFAWKLLRLEKRPAPWVTTILLAVMPTAFALAVRTASDWVFAFFSFGFLLLLFRMRDAKPSVWTAVSLGLLLGVCALTRSVGVLLGAAIVGQIFLRWWPDKPNRKSIPAIFKKSWPEMSGAVIGAAIWLAWGQFLKAEAAAGNLAKGNYDFYGGGFLWGSFEPVKMTKLHADLWFQSSNFTEKLGISGSVIELILLVIFAGIIVLGLWRTIREGRLQASDFYAVVTIGLVTMYYFKASRFFLVISPFLLAWFFLGLEFLWKPIAQKMPTTVGKWLPRSLSTLWISACLAICVVLIVRGNSVHHGLSPLVTKSESDFYKGYYADLWQMAEEVKTTDWEPKRVGINGWYVNSFQVWSGGLPTYDWRFYNASLDAFVTSAEHPDVPTEVAVHEKFTLWKENDGVKIFRRDDTEKN